MANGIRKGDPMDSIKDVVQSSLKVPEFDKHLKKPGGHIDRNFVEMKIKMKTIVRKRLMIKIVFKCLKKICIRSVNENFSVEMQMLSAEIGQRN